MKIDYPSVLIGVAVLIILLLLLTHLGMVEVTWKSEFLVEQVPRFYNWRSST